MSDLAADVVATVRRLDASGLNRGASGNVSARDGDDLLITPSAVPAAELTADLITRMPIAGNGEWSGALKPSSEWRFHRDLYRARTDVAGIVHTHAPFSTAMAVARQRIPAVHYMIAAFGGPDIRVAAYARYGTAALSTAVVAAMEGRNGCLMANHGMLTAGATLKQAEWLAQELEMLATLCHHAAAFGGAQVLTDAEVAEAAEAFASYRPSA